MKQFYTFILLAGITLLSFNTHAQSFDEPVEYLQFISDEHQDLTKQMWKYTKAIAHGKSDRNVKRKREKLVDMMQESIEKIQKAGSYNKENDFKQKIINNLQINKSLMNNEYNKIIDMKEVAQQSYDKMEAYMLAQEMADQKMEEAQKDYETYFDQYAEKYDIQINEQETDLGKKMRISGEVFSHYNDTYLIFFKSNMNESYLMKALESGDVSAIQQTANALKASAEEGIAQLDTLSAYKNDKALINATKKALEFYLEEVNTHVPTLTNFLIVNEDFETIKKNLENTPQKKRTQEMIDAYNKKVKEMNEGVNKFNNTNNILNQKRQKFIGQVNQTIEQYLDKHIPND